MGGNALSEPSVRLGREDYFNLWNKLKMSKFQLFLIPSYREKESFGDMDILIPSSYGKNYDNYKRLALEDVGLKIIEEVRNGSVTSFGIETKQGLFQIDLISEHLDTLPFAYHYFAYNDMGNLLGRVARSAGVKLGHRGLFYTQRAKDNDNVVLKEHLLTSKWNEALSFLKYDAERYGKGFNVLEDIFEYVMSSPFYDFNKFDLTQRNRKARIRDAKRPNYRAFLEYASANPKQKSSENTLQRTFEWFPAFEKEYIVCENNNHLDKLYKEKYNGDIVRSVTGLEGKELGKFMSVLSRELTRDVVLQLDEKYIESLIDLHYKEWERNELSNYTK